ncbi:MAG: hypothetical protein IPK81_05885 [Rhodospirillales bacterium]|nr:MAG: hypothetical protein IPK81_05885 [Rhodospirillales bacterium]
MFQRTPLPAGGPVVYHPGQPIMAPAQPAYRALSLDEIAAQNGAADESPSLLHRVAQRRNAVVTALITVASITSFVGVVYWAHRQNIEAGGSGLPIEIKAPDTPHKVKPDDPKGTGDPEPGHRRLPPRRSERRARAGRASDAAARDAPDARRDG